MRQYYLYSGTVHLAALFALLFLMRPGLEDKSRQTIFSVDFIGGAAQPLQAPAPVQSAKMTAAEQEKAAPQKARPQEHAQPKAKASDEIPVKPVPQQKPQEKIVLSQPSILKNAPLPKAEPAQEPAKEDTQNAEGLPPGGAMTAEFPNFPYPWYITQVRASLWNQWSARMPSGGRLAAVIGFQIGKNGTVSAIKAERSSGNKLFDFAAMSAVEAAAPFPPLPREYKQKALAVHVEFKVAE